MKRKSYFSTTKKHDWYIHIFLIFVSAFQIFPLIALLLNSLRTDANIKIKPVNIPEHITFENYKSVWVKGEYATAYLNSILIGFCSVLIVLFLGGMAAYALAKLNVPFRNFFLGYFTLGMSIPGFMYISPNYATFTKLGIIDTQLSMIIIYSCIFMCFNLLMIRTYFIGIPKELEEAGRIDGCNEISVVWHITFPLARPILTTVALLVFVNCWNEFLWANTFLNRDEVRTVSTRFYKFVGQYTLDLASIYTAGVIAILPIVILYLCLQKKFIEGMTAGGVKG